MTHPSPPCAAMRRRTGFAVLLAVLATACAHRGAPSAFPGIDATKAQPSLVIARFVSTGDLPEFPECKSRDVICMDPAPTWIKLKALGTVYGVAPERTFFASTTSHYGRINAYGGVEKPMLMLLRSHEGAHEMPRYSRAMLDADADRKLHLVLRNKGPHWLPCSTRALREEITDPVLARAARITRAHYVQYHAETNAEFFRVEGEFAHPRYSLPMARLEAHLAGRRLSTADFACESAAD